MGVSIWEGSKAQALIDAITKEQKVSKQQGVENAGKALVVGDDGIVGFGNPGISDEAKRALLDCIDNVMWTDTYGKQRYNALYKALLGEDGDSSKYWDYKWFASSGIIPPGIKMSAASFDIEDGALFCQSPSLQIDYAGECELEVEIKYAGADGYSPNYAASGPNIMVISNIGSETNTRGFITAYVNNNTTKLGVRVSSEATQLTDFEQGEYHVANMKYENGLFTATIDGTIVATGTGNEGAKNYAQTGLYYYYTNTVPRAFVYIKSIKFRKIR